MLQINFKCLLYFVFFIIYSLTSIQRISYETWENKDTTSPSFKEGGEIGRPTSHRGHLVKITHHYYRRAVILGILL